MMEFGFGVNDDAIGKKSQKFKAKEGEKYRISFLWWEGLDKIQLEPELDLTQFKFPGETPKFIGCKRLYVENVGYFIDKGADFQKLAGGEVGRQTVATIIAVWPTDKNGKLLSTTNLAEVVGRTTVYPWVFSGDKYNQIKGCHDQFPLGDFDVQMACTDAKFQKMTFNSCRENLFKVLLAKDKNLAAPILRDAMDVARNIGSELAQDLSLAQIRAKLGQASETAGGGGNRAPAVVSSTDFDSMLEGFDTK